MHNAFFSMRLFNSVESNFFVICCNCQSLFKPFYFLLYMIPFLFQYVRNVAVAFAVYSIIGISVAMISSRFQTSKKPIVPQICITELGVPNWFADLLHGIGCILGWITVAIYMVVFVALRKIDSSQMTAAQQTQMKQQSKATVTVAIIAAVSFVRL